MSYDKISSRLIDTISVLIMTRVDYTKVVTRLFWTNNPVRFMAMLGLHKKICLHSGNCTTI